MITVPSSHEQVQWCRNYLEAKGGLWVSEHTQFLVWERDGMPKWVVGFDDWMGSTCQLYMASELGYLLPTKLIKATFHHGFNVLKRTHIFGVVNSLNSRAMRLDTWLGFTEVLRVAGAHEGGGDIVVFQMTPETCRWLERNQNGQKEVSHP